MDFRITGLPAERFTDLFTLPQSQLATRGALRMIADGHSGYPCRVSLTDAAEGDTVYLVNYEHHAVETPYRSRFATIYVRPGERTYDEINRVPEQLRKRLLSLRAYDADGMLMNADVVEGTQLESGLAELFSSPRVSYVHAHFARPGCYAARIDRV
jgi:Protein of unknown function (DUF1203)